MTSVSHSQGENLKVIEKVFEGYVLTNERSYSTQLAMLNSPNDFDRLKGVIYRPEEFHRIMNLGVAYLISIVHFIFFFNSID